LQYLVQAPEVHFGGDVQYADDFGVVDIKETDADT